MPYLRVRTIPGKTASVTKMLEKIPNIRVGYTDDEIGFFNVKCDSPDQVSDLLGSLPQVISILPMGKARRLAKGAKKASLDHIAPQNTEVDVIRTIVARKGRLAELEQAAESCSELLVLGPIVSKNGITVEGTCDDIISFRKAHYNLIERIKSTTPPAADPVS